MVIKTVTNSDLGTADVVGGDDWDNLATIINNDHKQFNIAVIQSGSTYYVLSGGAATSLITSSSNATTAVQAGINALTASRSIKETVVLRGTFSITKLTIPSYTVLDCTKAKLTQASSTNDDFLINADTSGGNTQIEIKGGYIDGNKAGQSASVDYRTRNIIGLHKVTDSSVEGCFLINANGSGVDLFDCTNVTVSKCTIKNPAKLGLYSAATDATTSNYISFLDNYIDNCGENFMGVYGSNDVNIRGNQCNTCTTTGVNVDGGSRVKVANNILKTITTTGIVVSTEGFHTTDYVSVIDNEVWEAKTGGITINTGYISDVMTISRNKVKGAPSGQATTAVGIRAFAGTNSVFEGNHCWNWQRSGMSLEGSSASVGGRTLTANHCIISHNICWDNGANTGDATPDYRAGINISGTSGYILALVLHDNICYDTLGASGTQLYGISYKNTTDINIHDNDLRGNKTTALFDNTGNITPTIYKNLGSTVLEGDAVFTPSPDIKKHGEFWALASASPASGSWQGFISNTVVGSGAFSNTTIDSAGLRGNWTTGTTINSICGSRTTAVMTERDLNPYGKWKIAFPTAVSTLRFFIGFLSSATAPVSAADYAANLSAVGFWYDSSVDAHLHIMQNDGSASSDTTTIGNIADPTTAVRTYELRAINASSKFQYRYDGGAWTDINTKIPAATTDLAYQWFAECLAGTAARVMSQWYALGRWDSP